MRWDILKICFQTLEAIFYIRELPPFQKCQPLLHGAVFTTTRHRYKTVETLQQEAKYKIKNGTSNLWFKCPTIYLVPIKKSTHSPRTFSRELSVFTPTIYKLTPVHWVTRPKNFIETDTETFFRDQIFSRPILRLFLRLNLFETETETFSKPGFSPI